MGHDHVLREQLFDPVHQFSSQPQRASNLASLNEVFGVLLISEFIVELLVRAELLADGAWTGHPTYRPNDILADSPFSLEQTSNLPQNFLLRPVMRNSEPLLCAIKRCLINDGRKSEGFCDPILRRSEERRVGKE